MRLSLLHLYSKSESMAGILCTRALANTSLAAPSSLQSLRSLPAFFSACKSYSHNGASSRGTQFGGGASRRAVTRISMAKDLHVLSSITTQDQEIFFARAGINRVAERRANPSWLVDAFSTAEALVVPVLGSKNLVNAGEPVLLASSSFRPSDRKGGQVSCNPIFLGLKGAMDVPVFAVEVSVFCSTNGDEPAWLVGGEWVDLRQYGPELQASDAGLLAYARGMIEWHSRNRFCGRCGEHMEIKDGGHSLLCSGEECGSTAYPRLDPAVIMLVTCGNYVLLGRQSRWEQGRYSILAGFVEIGETFEMAVAREVHEETGVKVRSSSIRYAASQPWPFPSSLMVGFTAEAEWNSTFSLRNSVPLDQVVPVGNDELLEVEENSSLPLPSADLNELEDARWIHKDFLRASLLGMEMPGGVQFHVPGKYAIAHILLQRWVKTGTGTVWAGNLIQTVEIDEGIFKYVLISTSDNYGNKKLIVRGDGNLAYHTEIIKQTQQQLKALELKVEVLGGGRMEHLSEQHVIHVYGFSQAYGQANHAVTATILRQWFPFHVVTFSWEGY